MNLNADLSKNLQVKNVMNEYGWEGSGEICESQQTCLAWFA